VYEGDGRVSQGRDGVVSVPRILCLVQSRAPVEVEEEVRLGDNLPAGYRSGTVGREGWDSRRESRCGRVYLWRGADEPQASKAALVTYKNR